VFRRNVAGQNLGLVLVNASTGAALTGATIAVKRVVDGAAQASATGVVTEAGGGQYNFAPSAADTNGNSVSFLFTATGAVPVEKTVLCTACDPTSAASFGITNLDAAVSTRSTYAGGPVASVAAPVAIAAAGLDNVVVEAGINARQALAEVLAASAGVVAGMGTGTVVIKGGGVAATRISATTDVDGNRIAVTLTPPA
jgi:hypothetical protein